MAVLNRLGRRSWAFLPFRADPGLDDNGELEYDEAEELAGALEEVS
jgi:hypothetical protein